MKVRAPRDVFRDPLEWSRWVRQELQAAIDGAEATELYLTSPNGTRYKLTVDDAGNLVVSPG